MIGISSSSPAMVRPSMAGYDNVVEPFLAAVAAHPDRTALICGESSQSFAETNAAINRVAALLRNCGVLPGEKVAYLLPNGATLIEVYYAIAKIGAIAVPINFRSIAPELEYFLDASDASVLIFAHQYAPRVAAVQQRMPRVRLQLCADGRTDAAEDLRELCAELPDTEPELFRDPSAVSRIQFTGGTTGAPKGAQRTHRADLVEFEGTYGSNWLYADETKVVLIQCPLEHHGGHAWFATSLSLGATLVLCCSFDPETILAQIERCQVSYMILLPPTTYVRLMEHPAINGYDLSSVRLVQSSAGGTSPEIVEAIYRHFPNAVMNYGWGQTETGLGSSIVLTREMATQRLPRIQSIGTAMPLMELKVVDENGVEVPAGVIGECAARSEALMSGYYKQPELTAAAYTPDGWLRTGDLMVRDADGYLYLKARKRELIKSGGENVFISEVENVVREHPAVLDAMVYGRPDPVMDEAVAVAVELRDQQSLSLTELQEFCRQRLASFKKPRSLTVLDSLDRDFSGKIRRCEVIRRCEDQQARELSLTTQPQLDEVFTKVNADPEVYRIEMPQRPGHDTTTNAYLVRTPAGCLLVDPGSPHEQAHGTVLRAFDQLGLDPDHVDIFVTHEHVDHAGLVRRWLRPDRQLVLSSAARQHLRQTQQADYAEAVTARLAAAGFSPAEVAEFEALRMRAYALDIADLPVCEAGDGDQFTLAGLSAQVITTPGHTVGHACLYLPDSGLLFSGDHVLTDPAPALFTESEDFGLLAAYFDSLAKLADLKLTTALPGHGAPMTAEAFGAGLSERRDHHRCLLADLRTLVTAIPHSTAAQLLAVDTDRRSASNWADLPDGARWCIASTNLARLDYLVAAGAIEATTGPDGLTHY